MTDESSLSDNVATIYALYADANTSAAPGTASPGGTSTGSNRVYWDFDAVHHRVTITWDDVLPGDPSVKAGNAFQLTLADKSDLTGIKGDFDIILRYESINWLSHDRSRAGIETGYSDHDVSVSRPDIPAALLDLPNQSNVGMPGVFNYQVRNAQATTLEFSFEPYGFSGWLDNRDGSGEFSYFNIFEGTGAVTPLQFTVDRAGPRDKALNVAWYIRGDGRAGHVIDADDLANHTLSGVLHFDAGQSSASLTLPIVGDDLVEDNELLDIVFTSDAIIETSRFQIKIVDDEPVQLVGTNDADTLIGGAGNDVLRGMPGDDVLTGGLGDDTIEGGAGKDSLLGGSGADTVSYEGSSAGVVVNLALQGRGRFQDTSGAGSDLLSDFEDLTGSAYNDTLIGNLAANVLTGLAGDDKLDGRGGGDTLIGGKGNDKFYIRDGGDSAIEHVGEGADRMLAYVSATIAANVERLDLLGTAAINGTGNAAANLIFGNQADNVISGGGGADRFTGRGGNDTFVFPAAGAGVTPVIITDFTSGSDHLSIEVDAGSPLGLHAGTALADAELRLGSRAQTVDQHLVYNPSTGALFYDSDGAGGQAQIKIAVLLGHPELHASDIDVIAI